MHIKKCTLLIFLLSSFNMLFSCPLCLSLPKNTDKPFFIEKDIDQIEESINVAQSTDLILAPSRATDPLK